ncbi:MmcB family DNA repair protein [Pantoea sp. JGM49]|uniref:sce7726 family protein n=1 Tax=unclassified Pantoea TaxID=2630326 RepID=UPI001BAB502D|nr:MULTISPECIES: sce7726 family protein [unclassified Pantoea]MBS0882178.1 MmcB family DNA repair protein [Pantoea sp. JGM49]
MKEIEIKTRLVEFLLEFGDTDAILSSEFRFNFGSRRADLISLHENMATSYEIKGASDNTSRLDYQILSYKDYFDYCYVVCEKENLKSIRDILPRSIGIIVVYDNFCKAVRKPIQNKNHSKIMLASTLSVEELKYLTKYKLKLSKYELCLTLSSQKSLKFIRDTSRKSLLKYSENRFKVFKSEIGNKISSDDILTITRMPSDKISKFIS